MATSKSIFLSIAAQADNLGDIAIRQVCLDMLAESGENFVIFVGDMPRSYIEAFDLPAGARIEQSSLRYSFMLISGVLRGRAHIVFAPGPFVAGGIARTIKSIGLLGLIRLTRARGGQVLALGRALRGNGRLALQVQRATIAAASVFTTRDDATERIVRRPVTRRPDLALHKTPQQSSTKRDRVAISLRSDKPVSLATLRVLVSEASSFGLATTFVTQVQRDDDQHRVLAAKLGAEHVAWQDESHAEQLRRVQATYRRSLFVVTDRLHAAVFGINSGCIPVIVEHDNPDKLVSTLGPYFDLPKTSLGERGPGFSFIGCDSSELSRKMRRSSLVTQEELKQLSNTIVSSLSDHS